MITFQQARQLLWQPYSARMIQIASLVKQAILADEVIVMRPLDSVDQSLDIVWSEGHTRSDRSLSNTQESTSVHILSQDVLQAIALSKCESSTGIHCYQDGYLWSGQEVGADGVQAIRYWLTIDSMQLIFVWVRNEGRPFTEQERMNLVILTETAAKEFATSDREKKYADGEAVSGNISLKQGKKSHHLSQKESEILGLLNKGLTERAIAEKLQRSHNTIHAHVRSIYKKLLVNSRAELLNKIEAME